ncbi:MAG: sulfite exporter TauE/SafE family protein [Pseudomonadota bacterium]|nr:sulfite exporter TauE/SafE family protein [Pseudomonadota bacterium]
MTLLPADLSLEIAGLLVAASFVTSALTAAFGIGGGVALLVLLGYALPVAALIPVHGVVQFGSNVGRAAIQRAHIRWRALVPFVAGAALGAAAGTPFVRSFDDPPLKIALAFFIIVVTWVKLPALARGGARMFALGGFTTTFATMFFGATGPLTAAFLEKALPDRLHYSGTHAAAMVASHGFKIVAFGLAGFAFGAWLPLIAAMLASGFAGTLVGARALLRLPEARFRLVFRVLITVLALELARRGVMASGWIQAGR